MVDFPNPFVPTAALVLNPVPQPVLMAQWGTSAQWAIIFDIPMNTGIVPGSGDFVYFPDVGPPNPCLPGGTWTSSTQLRLTWDSPLSDEDAATLAYNTLGTSLESADGEPLVISPNWTVVYP